MLVNNGFKQKEKVMKDSEANRKFRPQHERESFVEKTKDWKISIFSYSIIILFCFSSLNSSPKGKIFSWQVGVPLLVGAIILYVLISVTIDWFKFYIKMRDREIEHLRRQFTCFICEATLGWIEKEDLERLRKTARLIPSEKQNNLAVDDFSLISTANIFWGKDGFEWQDEKECANCGHERKEHSRDGNCPVK